MRHARWKVHQSARLDFLEFVFHFNHSASLKSHVAVGSTPGIRGSPPMHVVRGRAARVVVHLSRLDRVGRCESAAIAESNAGLGTEPADASTAGIAERTKGFPVEKIARPACQPV